MLTSSKTSSPPDIIINLSDPIQNPGQTWIFYKAGQTRLTWAKRNPFDPDDPDDPTRLQCWLQLSYYMPRIIMHACLLTYMSNFHAYMEVICN